jgi:hypothetical protein
VSEASTDGTLQFRVVDQAGRHLHHVTAVALAQHLRDGQLRGTDKPVRLTPTRAW